MNAVKIVPSKLFGEITVPPSKSIAHRAVICAGLADGESTINNISFSDDITATISGMEVLGAEIGCLGNTLRVHGRNKVSGEKKVIDCGESGSTLRFLIPLALFTGESIAFTGRGKLVARPLDSYYQIFDEQGISYSTDRGRLPLTVQGTIKSGIFSLPGNISSQFVSGLLFALPLLEGSSRIVIASELESKGYVDLTLDSLKHFGIRVENRDYREFIIPGGQCYKSGVITVEGDFSQAAFWLAAGTLGADINCRGLNKKSLQGDKAILDIIERMGGRIVAEEGNIRALPARTRGIDVDVSQCPDLVPVLAVLASLSEGVTRITNAARLRIKESDRLAAITSELKKIDADIEEEHDGLVIRGKEELQGGAIDSWNDHRIAMALAVASIRCREPVLIKNSSAVKKSYPDFWEEFVGLGGKIDGCNMGK